MDCMAIEIWFDKVFLFEQILFLQLGLFEFAK